MGCCLSLHKPFGIGAAKAGASPISRLPDSILHSVFMDVADIEPVYDIHGLASALLKPPSYYDCLGWTRLSAVCRRWRAVLLGAAQLWADVVFGLPPDMAVLALTRSGVAPLNIIIPPCQDMSSDSLRKLASRKKWQLPHTHRERLLNLAVNHLHRIGQLSVEDLSAQEYHCLLKSGIFDALTSLDLEYAYNESGLVAPSREDISDLRIVAPHVRTARFSATLPIACENGPGLHLVLPNLRRLKICASLSWNVARTSVPTSAAQLRWIPSLICGSSMLEELDIELLIGDLVVDWELLSGGKRGHLSALRDVDVRGSPGAHLDQLFDLIAPDMPMNITIALHMMELDILETPETYASILERSMRLHSLDSVYLSQTSLELTSEDEPGVPFSKTNVLVEAFPSTELRHLETTLESYLCRIMTRSLKAAKAGLLVISEYPSLGPHENILSNPEDTLNLVAPALSRNEIKTLILDEGSTEQWANAMREVMQSCLLSVTTLYCVNSVTSASTEKPCTAALRLLHDTNKDGTRNRSPLTRLSLSLSESALLPAVTQEPVSHNYRDILPSLITIVVTMNIMRLKNTADVSTWWDELIYALRYRHDVGLRVRVLRIVGGWTTEKLRKRTAKMDSKMLTRARTLVDEVVDERTVS
ncbi:hypothetical protein PENSPDRAFT_687881 [Peniophora sp. CONT]|nr:hypothetical protein PENSPDRAFT_687881 [Peniophora sp. CONT]